MASYALSSGGNSNSNPYTYSIPDNTNNFNTIQENEKRKLQNSYNDLVRQATNALNSRGLFGSSVASEDIGKVNYGMGQSLAELGGQSAGQQVTQNQQNVQNQLAVQQANQQATQFNQTLDAQKAQQKAAQTQASRQNEIKLATILGSVDPLNAKSYLNDVLNKYRYL